MESPDAARASYLNVTPWWHMAWLVSNKPWPKKPLKTVLYYKLAKRHEFSWVFSLNSAVLAVALQGRRSLSCSPHVPFRYLWNGRTQPSHDPTWQHACGRPTGPSVIESLPGAANAAMQCDNASEQPKVMKTSCADFGCCFRGSDNPWVYNKEWEVMVVPTM